MKTLLLALFFLVGCSDQPNVHEQNAQLVKDLSDSLYDCQNQRFNARMEIYRLEDELSKFKGVEEDKKQEQHEAKYKASNKNLTLPDLQSGNRFLVDDNDKVRIFLELPGNRYSFIIDDENRIYESVRMGTVNSKKEALDYAKENGYGRIK